MLLYSYIFAYTNPTRLCAPKTQSTIAAILAVVSRPSVPDKVGEAGQHERPRQRPLAALRVQLHVPLAGEGDAGRVGGGGGARRRVRALHGLADRATRASDLEGSAVSVLTLQTRWGRVIVLISMGEGPNGKLQ